MPKVSIIIATHSRPNLLPRAVKSAFEAGSDVEVIVVDDASTDETAEVCQKLKDIKYIRVERNQRTAGARNIGILNSTAPYIGFLDDDDWRLPGVLDKQVCILDNNPEVGLVYGRYFFGDQSGKIINEPAFPPICPKGDIFHRLFEENMIGCLTAVFRKECLYRVGMLDPNYSGIDDWDLWIRIAELYPILAVEEPVAVWRKAEPGSGQGSSDAARLYLLAIKAFNKKWSKLPRIKEKIPVSSKSGKGFHKIWADGIFYHAIHSPSNKLDKLYKVFEAIKIYPPYLSQLHFYKVVIKNILFK
jgi:glycosyltransferase involved in cell wall biosynthesis